MEDNTPEEPILSRKLHTPATTSSPPLLHLPLQANRKFAPRISVPSTASATAQCSVLLQSNTTAHNQTHLRTNNMDTPANPQHPFDTAQILLLALAFFAYVLAPLVYCVRIEGYEGVRRRGMVEMRGGHGGGGGGDARGASRVSGGLLNSVGK